MSQPFAPGYGQVYSITASGTVQQLRFTNGMSSWCRIKAEGSATVYFNAQDAASQANGLALNAEVFEGPLQARELWLSGSGKVSILALIPA